MSIWSSHRLDRGAVFADEWDSTESDAFDVATSGLQADRLRISVWDPDGLDEVFLDRAAAAELRDVIDGWLSGGAGD